MKLALEEARRAYNKAEVPIGAVVVKEDEVIARSHNLREKLADPTAHAEILAVKRAANNLGDWRLYNCTIYVTVEPCIMCAGALVQARVERLVYGTTDLKAGAAGSVLDLVNSSKFNHQLEVKSAILEDECKKIMKSFFQDLRQGRIN